MKYTKNYILILPDPEDFYDVAHYNGNFEKIDRGLKEHPHDIATVEKDGFMSRAMVEKLNRLEEMVLNQVFGNPFVYNLDTLDGLIVSGVWNKDQQRIEF